ncbi:hypothetical protein COCCADRAFT_110646, partial [Bipolaris zeicola 26-R-13]
GPQKTPPLRTAVVTQLVSPKPSPTTQPSQGLRRSIHSCNATQMCLIDNAMQLSP